MQQSPRTQAADSLSNPRATATHSIKVLEEQLGARLLERTTRVVRTTLDGQAFYERCVFVLGELEEAETSLRHAAASPRGVLRVDMNSTHATKIVLPRIKEFHTLYPNVDLVISSGDRLVDLVREGIDCVIRAGEPRDSSLVARRLALMPQVLCASPAYLAAHGTPGHPSDLQEHFVVRFFASAGNVSYPVELQVEESLKEYESHSWISVNEAESYVVAACHGGGLIQVPRFHVEEELRDGRLVEVLPNFGSPALKLFAMYPFGRQLSPRVRTFVDWVSQIYEQRFDVGTAS